MNRLNGTCWGEIDITVDVPQFMKGSGINWQRTYLEVPEEVRISQAKGAERRKIRDHAEAKRKNRQAALFALTIIALLIVAGWIETSL